MVATLGTANEEGWYECPECGWDIKTGDSGNKSTAIYQIIDHTRWLQKNNQQLTDIGNRYLRVIRDLNDLYHCAIRGDHVENGMHRIETNYHMTVYIERMAESQFQFQSSLLAQQEAIGASMIAEASLLDALSMETAAYLTMVFLPVTVVSAIFSTSIFDSENGRSDGVEETNVVSPGWWVFVLCSGLATVITMLAWLGWHRRELNNIKQAKRRIVAPGEH